MSDFNQRLYQVISTQLKVDQDGIVPEASFIQDLGADSLAIVELVMAMEEEFNFSIPDDDAEKIRTVQDALSYLEAHKEDIQ